MNVAFPWRYNDRGLTASADQAQHIHDLMEQLLFTSPGERVNRPTFGTGLLQLVFAANSPELGAATRVLVQGALQQWLGELIQVEAVEIEQQEATLSIEVRYVIRSTQQRRQATFRREVS